MREIYKNGMTDEVFAWTAASNNQAFLAGRLSLALNAISIVALAPRTRGTRRSPTTPGSRRSRRGPVSASGNEHVMGIYVIWKFAKNKEAAKKFLVDQQLDYRQHFVRSQSTTSRRWTSAIKGGFKTIRKMAAADTHKPQRQVHDPDDDRGEVHDERRLPRQLERGDRRDLQHVPDPADVRPGRAGQDERRPTPSARVRTARRAASTASGRRRVWCRAVLSRLPRAPNPGPSSSRRTRVGWTRTTLQIGMFYRRGEIAEGVTPMLRTRELLAVDSRFAPRRQPRAVGGDDVRVDLLVRLPQTAAPTAHTAKYAGSARRKCGTYMLPTTKPTMTPTVTVAFSTFGTCRSVRSS